MIEAAIRRDIKGTTQIGGLIGRGIRHTLSPLIHNTAATLLGIDKVYIPFDLSEAPTAVFFKTLFAGNCYGFNVTVPYKEAIAELFASSAEGLKSGNTLFRGDNEWNLASTDAKGFFAGLAEIEHALSDFTAVIFLGYGGAAKALQTYVEAHAPGLPLYILKRGIAAEAGDPILKPFEPRVLTELLQRYPKTLLIQCTSAPLRGDDLARFSLKGLKGAFVDLVYGTPSAILSQAQTAGIPCQDGIPMLIHQALLAQQLWWGQAAPFSAIKAAIMRQS